MPWPRRRRRVRLHMKDSQPSIEGFLLARASGHYVMAEAQILEAPGRSIDMAGEVHVPARQVAFYQVLA